MHHSPSLVDPGVSEHRLLKPKPLPLDRTNINWIFNPTNLVILMTKHNYGNNKKNVYM